MKTKAPLPIDRYVGAAIRAARTGAGMSQTELGQHCGVSFQQMQKYEKGANRISASRMMRIADALKVPVGSFYPKDGNSKPIEAPAILQDRIGVEIASVWGKLEKRHRVVLRDLVLVMAKN